MDIKRMMRRRTTIGWSIDAIKNMVDNGDIVKGLKRTIKEDICEDNPITSTIYNIGKTDGRVEGYTEASAEYAKKLLKQGDEFIKQTKVFESQRDEYEKLLDEYDEEIERLELKLERSEAENEYLRQLLLRNRKLLKMVR